jgi:hypothetical protein
VCRKTSGGSSCSKLAALAKSKSNSRQTCRLRAAVLKRDICASKHIFATSATESTEPFLLSRSDTRHAREIEMISEVATGHQPCAILAAPQHEVISSPASRSPASQILCMPHTVQGASHLCHITNCAPAFCSSGRRARIQRPSLKAPLDIEVLSTSAEGPRLG